MKKPSNYMSFETTLERDDQEIDIHVFYLMAPAEPDVGIFSAYVDDLYAVNSDGKDIDLSAEEYESLCDKATEDVMDRYDE